MLDRGESSSLPRAAVNVWPELGQMIGVGKNAAYELANSNRIRVVRLGRRILVPVSAIDEFLAHDSRAEPS